jgi:hypothetical protein
MPTLTEGRHTAEFLRSEANGYLSREKIKIDSTAAALAAGTVLGKVTATGDYVAYNEAGTDDGRRVAAGILYAAAPDAAADQWAVAIVRDAEVSRWALTGLDANGEADLLALGIRVRD